MLGIKDKRRTVRLEDEIPIAFLSDEKVRERQEIKDFKSSSETKAIMLETVKLFEQEATPKVIKQIYKAVDFVVGNSGDSGISRVSVCRPGCSQCCWVAVDISQVEANYISTMTKKKITIDKARKKEGRCPFVKKNLCSIREYRPLACRVFHAIDHPKYCYTNEPHSIVTVFSNGFFSAISVYFDSQNTGDPFREVTDIRQYFK